MPLIPLVAALALAVLASLVVVACGGPGAVSSPTTQAASTALPAPTDQPQATSAQSGLAPVAATPAPQSPANPPSTRVPAPTAGRSSEATPASASPVSSPTASPPHARGGVLRTAVPLAPDHYDVHQDASTALVQWGPGIAYSRLLRFRTDEGAEIPNGEVECDLCDSWTLVGPLEYRIKLRDGVRWQDTAPVSGRPLVANDVVFSLRRQSSPGWPNAPLLATLKDIAAVDDLTVRLELTGPDIDFLARLADGHSRIVPPETVAVNGSLLAGPVIGTGPWELVDASTSGFRFVANRDYFESGLPYADALHIDILPAGDVRAAALRTRTIDFVSAGPVDLTRAVEAFPELRRSSAIQPGVGVEVAINTTSPPFNSTAARQAALLAIDPWLDAIEIWHGAASPTAGLPVPAPSWLVADEALREFLAHPDRALASAGDAGIRPGTPVTVTVGEFAAEYVEQAFRLAAGLASIGFAPALERVSTRRYGDEVWFGGRFQVSVGAPPPVADLSEYLFAVHHSRGAWNTTGYRSARLDVLIEAQSAETGILRRLGLVQEIQLEVMRGAHRFAPATFRSEWAWWPNVGGFVPNTYRGESHFLARTWLVRSDQ